VRWATHGVGCLFPEQWARFASVTSAGRLADQSLVDLYAALVLNPDPEIRDLAAREWCAWEDTHVSLCPGYTPNPRFEDRSFRLLFARLVTHYWSHAAFLGDDQLIHNASLLGGIPGVLLHGRYDISSPIETAWRLHHAWQGSELKIIDEAGHGGGAIAEKIVESTSRLALA
jgi:proline iminopeptidase